MVKAVGYVRVSTEEQTEGYGLDIQKKAIKEYAKKNKIEVEIFEDAGISGANGFDKRAGLKALFEFVSHNDIDYVIVHKYDRLSRDLFLQLFIEKELKKLNVKIISITEEQLSKDDYVSNMMRQLIGAFAEFEKNRIAERLFSGRKHKAKTERTYASSYYPYGYTNSGEIIQEQANIVKKIFEMYSQNYSLQDIADWLNSQGIRTKRGGDWSRQAVKNLLTNQIYVGIVKWGDVIEEKKEIAIIHPKIFKEVQRKLQENRKKQR